jgi:hypothetical protein
MVSPLARLWATALIFIWSTNLATAVMAALVSMFSSTFTAVANSGDYDSYGTVYVKNG